MLHHQHPDPVNPNRVIILGANGFVGQALSQKLTEQNISNAGLSYPEIDLTQEASVRALLEILEPTDTVILLAAIAANNRLDAKGFIDNINIAKNVCAALGQTLPKHFIYFSSDAVYSQEEETIAESSPAAPNTLYGAMHLTREILCQNMAVEHNIPFAIVRSTQIYGVNASHNAYGPMRMCRSAVSEGKINLFGQGEERRDFIAIEDVVDLLSLMMLHGTFGVVNFATGTSISFMQIATFIKQNMQNRVQIEYLERKASFFHRKFDMAALKKIFHHFEFKNIEKNLVNTYNEINNAYNKHRTSNELC